MGQKTFQIPVILWIVISALIHSITAQLLPVVPGRALVVNNTIEKAQKISRAAPVKKLQKDIGSLIMLQIVSNFRLDSVENALDQYKMNMIPSSCAAMNIKETNTYYIRSYGIAEEPFLVLCDFEDNYGLGGGWTVFLRRFNGIVDFGQNWTMYKNGFGDVYGEHWLGLEKLHALTRVGRHELLVLLEDYDGNSTYALYDDFKIGSETEKYNLTVGEYSGTAGDSLRKANGMKFSSFDNDNDPFMLENCARFMSGSWWIKECFPRSTPLLTGTYYERGEHLKTGIVWPSFRGSYYSLKSVAMMIRKRA